MDVRQLRSFLCVARLRNISKAAERLHVAQPALSRQIRLLEQELGVVLFNRKLRGVELTTDGERLVPHASDLVQRADAIFEEFNPHKPHGEQDLSIGMPEALARDILPILTSQFAKQYPGGRLNVKIGLSGLIRKWIENSEVDVGLIYGLEESADHRFNSNVLVREQLCVVAASHYEGRALPKPGQCFEFKHLAHHPLILISAANGVRRTLDRVATEVGVSLKPQLEIDNFSILLDLVQQNRGITILTRSSVEDQVIARRLKVWTLSDPTVDVTISLVSLRAREQSRPLRTLTNVIADQIRAFVSGRPEIKPHHSAEP